MATKKAVKKVEPKVVTITADQFLAAVTRFGTVCDYVESQMCKERNEVALERTMDSVRAVVGQAAQSAPKPPSPSVEALASEMREVARDVAKQAEAIRQRLTMGGETPDGGGCNAATPSQGPLKDYVESTTFLLYSIRRDLDTINQYAIG